MCPSFPLPVDCRVRRLSWLFRKANTHLQHTTTRNKQDETYLSNPVIARLCTGSDSNSPGQQDDASGAGDRRRERSGCSRRQHLFPTAEAGDSDKPRWTLRADRPADGDNDGAGELRGPPDHHRDHRPADGAHARLRAAREQRHARRGGGDGPHRLVAGRQVAVAHLGGGAPRTVRGAVDEHHRRRGPPAGCQPDNDWQWHLEARHPRPGLQPHRRRQ